MFDSTPTSPKMIPSPIDPKAIYTVHTEDNKDYTGHLSVVIVFGRSNIKILNTTREHFIPLHTIIEITRRLS